MTPLRYKPLIFYLKLLRLSKCVVSRHNYLIVQFGYVCGCWSVDCSVAHYWPNDRLFTPPGITSMATAVVTIPPNTFHPSFPVHKTVHNIPQHPQQHCGCLITRGKCSRFSLPTSAAAATCCILWMKKM